MEKLFRFLSAAPPATVPAADKYSLRAFLRPVHSVAPETRLLTVLEVLKSSPYRVVPVVRDGEYMGVVSEERIFSLLFHASESERNALREQSIVLFLSFGAPMLAPGMTPTQAAEMLEEMSAEALPVVDGGGRFLGMLGRSDLVAEMHRTMRPPTVGGMATPVGIHLTTGGASGGVRPAALVLTGLLMFSLQIVAFFVVGGLASLLPPIRLAVPTVARDLISETLLGVLQTTLFLLFLRATPVVAYHAAEHQVVHAIEQGEPLLLQSVRRMPRVHPRCGTNLAAGAMIFSGGYLLVPLLGTGGYFFTGIAALLYWRKFGGWLQQYMTTRPAGDKHILQAIGAARSLLEKQRLIPPGTTIPVWKKLWGSGMVQILCGFAIGYAFLLLVAWLIPPLRVWLLPSLTSFG